MVAYNTSKKTGLTEVELREKGKTVKGQFRNVGITLSAPKLDLMKGEKTTLTVKVFGLAGIKVPVPLVVKNESPTVISMSGGTLQKITIVPSQVKGDTYTMTRPLGGIKRGGFTITGTVVKEIEQPCTTGLTKFDGDERASMSTIFNTLAVAVIRYAYIEVPKKKRITDEDGNVIIEFEYDQKGRKVKRTDFDKNGKPTGIREYDYDIEGRVGRERRYDGNRTKKGSREFRYDENGKMIESVDRDANGNLSGSTSFEYDENGTLTKSTNKDADGDVTDSSEYEFDADGNITKTTGKDSAGNVTSTEEREFDDEGNLKKVTNKDGAGKTTGSTEYEYDDIGRETKETVKDGDGRVLESHELEFDAEGNIKKETHIDENGNKKTLELEYDAEGNIIKETVRNAAGEIISSIEPKKRFCTV
jgi:hypothetical protein